MNQANPGPTPTETATGHAVVMAKMCNGQSERVTVKQIGLRRMQELGAAVDDPGKMILLATEKSPEWLDRVTPDSFEQLALEADRVNEDFLGRYLRLQKQRMGGILVRVTTPTGGPVQAPVDPLPSGLPISASAPA